MTLRSFNYYAGEAFRGIARNSIMAVSSAATVASCVFMLIASVCVALNVDYILEQFENKVGITVFIDDSLDENGVQGLYQAILAVPHVKEVKYISSEEALMNFSKLYDGSQKVFEDLEKANPLRRSFSVKLDGGRYQDNAIAVLAGRQMADLGAANVSHAKESMSVFMSINNVVRVVALIMVAILAVLSVVIIVNTIKLAVNSRRNEITIMKYVGATDWFIKWPFVIEGVIIGVAGAAVSAAVCWPLYAKAVSVIDEKVPMLSQMAELLENTRIFPMLTPLALLLGLLIGIIGSLTSTRKYLDV